MSVKTRTNILVNVSMKKTEWGEDQGICQCKEIVVSGKMYLSIH